MKKRNPARPNRPHFDYPILSETEITTFLGDPKNIAKHAFYPFLVFEIKNRRFRKDPKNKKRYKIDIKKRPIRVSSHRDTYIFNHYNKIVSEAYEEKISGSIIDECVLAYRSGKGSNIDFANEAFGQIAQIKESAVIAADLSKFYETIDHCHLKEKWSDLLGKSMLPVDHFQVFKAITNYAVVDQNKLKSILGIKKKDQLPRPIFKNMRTYRETIRTKDENGENLIKRNNDDYGIPQGSPISALLSNISMLDFDFEMAAFVRKIGGIYRRYSDDILIAVPKEYYFAASDKLSDLLKKVPGPISENRDKRVNTVFDSNGKYIHGDCTVSKQVIHSRILQNLGFLFDGNKVSIRSQTLARYWRKATRGIRAAKRRADKNPTDKRVYKRKLYKRFSHLGRQNLHTYKRNSIKRMDVIGIEQQFTKNWDKLQKEIKGPIKKAKKPSRS